MLTDAKARNAKPAAKAYKLADSNGLHLAVNPGGSKVWRWRYERQGDGKEQLLTIGHYPAVSLAEARRLRDSARDARRAGQSPAEAIRPKVIVPPTTPSFEAVARAWYQLHQAGWTERHADDVIRSLERDVFPALGSLPIGDITVPQVLAVVRAIEARPAVETAHRIRQRMEAVFGHAIAEGVVVQNPAIVVQRALARVVRGRQPAIVDLDGVREVLRQAEAIPAHPATRLALRLMALTAVRGGELRGASPAEFDDLDGPAPVWILPADRMKAKREHVVPLSRQAAEVVRLAIRLQGRGPLTFPSTRNAHTPMSENAIGYLLNRAGYHGRHVPHGWRAAFSSIMNERYPADRAIIDLMLAHAPDNKVEAAYNRAQHLGRRRELAQLWADLLLEGMAPPSDLLTLPRRPGPDGKVDGRVEPA